MTLNVISAVCLKPYISKNIGHISYVVFTCESERVDDLLYFFCHIKSERIMKVASSRIHCTSGYILETVQDSDVVTTNHQQEMIYDPSNRTVSDE